MTEDEREAFRAYWREQYGVELDDLASTSSWEAVAAVLRESDMLTRIKRVEEILRAAHLALYEETDANESAPEDGRGRWTLARTPPTPDARPGHEHERRTVEPITDDPVADRIDRLHRTLDDASRQVEELDFVLTRTAVEGGVSRETLAQQPLTLALGRAADFLAEVTTRVGKNPPVWSDVARALGYFGHDPRFAATGDTLGYLAKAVARYRKLVTG